MHFLKNVAEKEKLKPASYIKVMKLTEWDGFVFWFFFCSWFVMGGFFCSWFFIYFSMHPNAYHGRISSVIIFALECLKMDVSIVRKI